MSKRSDEPHTIPHRDLYSLAEIYEAVLSWNPEKEVLYLLSLLKIVESYTSIIDVSKALLLDIGCRTGRVARGFENLGIDALCLDISYEMCSYAHRLRKLEALNADMLAIPTRNSSIDIAYRMLAMLNHIEGIEALEQHLEEVYRVLRD